MEIGQFSNNPKIQARSVFFEELKALVPEVIEDLKNSCLELKEKECHRFIALDVLLRKQLEETIPDNINLREMRYRFRRNNGDLEVDKEYAELREKYWSSLEDWANRWNLGKQSWKGNEDFITHLANEEINTLLDPELNRAYTQVNNLNRLLTQRNEAPGRIIKIYSLRELKERYGLDWGEVEEEELSEEEMAVFMAWPVQDDDPKLFIKLLNTLSSLIPNQQILFAPHSHDFFLTENWNPDVESRGDFTKRIKDRFSKQLEEYISIKEAVADHYGMQPTPMALTRKPRETEYIFEWLIQFQVQGLSKNMIANNYKVTHKAVRDSINSKASLIGLIPRE